MTTRTLTVTVTDAATGFEEVAEFPMPEAALLKGSIRSLDLETVLDHYAEHIDREVLR